MIDAATLVFKSIRTGFPNASITAFINTMPDDQCFRQVLDACEKAEAEVLRGQYVHQSWIEMLTMSEQQPFYVMDTDMVFWENFERWTFDTALAGRCIPQYRCPFMKSITMARLHASMLYIDPVQTRQLIKEYEAEFPETPFNIKTNLFAPTIVPILRANPEVQNEVERINYFYDTCGLLFNAIGGHGFGEEHLNCYDHLNCGTIIDYVAPHFPNGETLREFHQAVYQNPELARGVWRKQDEFYRSQNVSQ